MESKLSKSHTGRNLAVCIFMSFVLFLISSLQILNYLLASRFIPRNTVLGPISLELSIATTLVISLIAIPLGYGFMLFFGGVVSTRAIKLYLWVMHGKSVIASRATDLEEIAGGKGHRLGLRRQAIYFGFILAVVVSFAIYWSRHGVFPIASPLSKTSDVIPLITMDFVSLTMYGSLMLPVVALALPYFGGLRLRTIDAGPFHTSLLTFLVGVSGGFTLLYSLLTRPVLSLLTYYFLLFMGVCWCLALGCNLAADPANRQIVHDVLSEKNTAKLVSSKIWLENPPGKFVEV
jgi:hypothetical protein